MLLQQQEKSRQPSIQATQKPKTERILPDADNKILTARSEQKGSPPKTQKPAILKHFLSLQGSI